MELDELLQEPEELVKLLYGELQTSPEQFNPWESMFITRVFTVQQIPNKSIEARYSKRDIAELRKIVVRLHA